MIQNKKTKQNQKTTWSLLQYSIYSTWNSQCFEYELGEPGMKWTSKQEAVTLQSSNTEAIQRKCTEVYPIQVWALVKCSADFNSTRLCPGYPLLWGLLGGVVMNVYSSLVCIEVVLCLAVISTALQKLHKCVTENTTELRNMSTHWRLWPNHTAGPEAAQAAAAGQAAVGVAGRRRRRCRRRGHQTTMQWAARGASPSRPQPRANARAQAPLRHKPAPL